MKTVLDIRRLALKHGATVEEDEGYRDMRVFQIIAPDGQLWNEGLRMIRVDWTKVRTPQAIRYNESEFALLTERMQAGHYPIPEDQLYLYATD